MGSGRVRPGAEGADRGSDRAEAARQRRRQEGPDRGFGGVWPADGRVRGGDGRRSAAWPSGFPRLGQQLPFDRRTWRAAKLWARSARTLPAHPRSWGAYRKQSRRYRSSARAGVSRLSARRSQLVRSSCPVDRPGDCP